MGSTVKQAALDAATEAAQGVAKSLGHSPLGRAPPSDDAWGLDLDESDAVHRPLGPGFDQDGSESSGRGAGPTGRVAGITKADLREELRSFIEAFGELYGPPPPPVTPGLSAPSLSPFPLTSAPPPTPAPALHGADAAGFQASVEELKRELREIKAALTAATAAASPAPAPAPPPAAYLHDPRGNPRLLFNEIQPADDAALQILNGPTTSAPSAAPSQRQQIAKDPLSPAPSSAAASPAESAAARAAGTPLRPHDTPPGLAQSSPALPSSAASGSMLLPANPLASGSTVPQAFVLVPSFQAIPSLNLAAAAAAPSAAAAIAQPGAISTASTSSTTAAPAAPFATAASVLSPQGSRASLDPQVVRTPRSPIKSPGLRPTASAQTLTPRGEGTASAPRSPVAGGAPDSSAPRAPRSYMEVLEMLERGETPPGINERIRDTPVDPSVKPTAPKLQPRRKPWERQESNSLGLVADAVAGASSMGGAFAVGGGTESSAGAEGPSI